jgi:hypothetical protein
MADPLAISDPLRENRCAAEPVDLSSLATPPISHAEEVPSNEIKRCYHEWRNSAASLVRRAQDLCNRIQRRMTKVAQLRAHAGQQIISLQASPEIAAAARDAVVRRLCAGICRFVGVKKQVGALF